MQIDLHSEDIWEFTTQNTNAKLKLMRSQPSYVSAPIVRKSLDATSRGIRMHSIFSHWHVRKPNAAAQHAGRIFRFLCSPANSGTPRRALATAIMRTDLSEGVFRITHWLLRFALSPAGPSQIAAQPKCEARFSSSLGEAVISPLGLPPPGWSGGTLSCFDIPVVCWRNGLVRG